MFGVCRVNTVSYIEQQHGVSPMSEDSQDGSLSVSMVVYFHKQNFTRDFS